MPFAKDTTIGARFKSKIEMVRSFFANPTNSFFSAGNESGVEHEGHVLLSNEGRTDRVYHSVCRQTRRTQQGAVRSVRNLLLLFIPY
jgi:hypothetical protein